MSSGRPKRPYARVRLRVSRPNENYRELVRHAPVAICEIDFPAERFVSVNDAMCDMLGLGREELLAMDPLGLLDEKDRAPFRSQIATWVNGEKPDTAAEYRVSGRDGRVLDVGLDVTFTADESGKPAGATVIARDITERKRAEKQLREALARAEEGDRMLSALMEYVPEGITMVDAALNMTRVSRYGEELLGGPHEGMQTTDVAAQWRVYQADGETLLPDDELPVMRAVKHGEIVKDVELVQANSRGEHVPLLCSAGPIRNAAGNVIGGIVAWRDISEQKAHQELLRTTLESIGDGFFACDADWRFVYVNAPAERILGIRRDEVLGRSHWEVFPLTLGTVLEREYRRAAAGEIRDFENYYEPWGRWFHNRCFPREGGGISVYFRDITEQKQAEKSLRRYAERLRSLHEIDEHIIAAHSLKEAAQTVVRQISQLLPCLRTSVVIYEPGTQELSLLATFSQKGESALGSGWRGPADPTWDPVFAELMEGRSYIVGDMQALPSSSPLMAQLRAEGVRAQIYEPVLIHERLLGMLGVGMATAGAVPAEHIEVIHELALQLAIGLEQVYLYEQVQRHADELESLVQERTASLEASEARFRTIFEGAGIGIALATAEGRLVATNPALRRMLGYSEQELVGMDFVRLLDNADPAAQTWLTELVARQASETSIETRYRRRDGQRGDANATVSWLREDAGAPPLVLALVDDITERKRAEDALHQAMAYNRSLIEASLDPLVTIGPDGRINDVNMAAETATGRSRSELIGTDFANCFTEPAKARASYERVFREGSVRDFELELRHRDGHTTSVLYNASVYRNEGGAVTGIFAAARDITERKRTHEALIQTERLAAMGRMTASLAHEINNPIQAVVGCLGLAMENLDDGEDATEYMSVAMNELRRAARIVHRMRDMGRGGEGHRELTKVGDLVRNVVLLTRNQAQNRGVELIWEGDDGLQPATIVGEHIQQVFLNLVLNAIDAMPDGGELRIRAGDTEEPLGVRISFADSGLGIAPEEVRRMFEAFHSTKELGLGLGLFVSRNIVREHGGRIDVESELGHGATFHVWLPRSAMEDQTQD